MKEGLSGRTGLCYFILKVFFASLPVLRKMQASPVFRKNAAFILIRHQQPRHFEKKQKKRKKIIYLPVAFSSSSRNYYVLDQTFHSLEASKAGDRTNPCVAEIRRCDRNVITIIPLANVYLTTLIRLHFLHAQKLEMFSQAFK